MKPLHLSGRVPLIAALLCFALQAHASVLFSTNYGNYSAVSVCYNDVSESSGTDANALYNAPSITGNTLNFNPDFTAFADGSEGNASDTTDGQLGFDICTLGGNFIDELVFSERGDYSFSSFGNTALVDVSASFIVEVLDVDGVELLTPVNGEVMMTFSPNDEGTFSFSGFGLTGLLGWTGSMSMNILDLLTTNDVPFINGATKIHVELDNQLQALAQSGTEAFIAKKDFQGFSVTSIPEPSSLVLIGLTASMIGFIRRRFIA